MWALFKVLMGLGFIVDGLYIFIFGGIMGQIIESDALFGIAEVSGWLALLAGAMDIGWGFFMIGRRRKRFL